jgi:hypothetical protein
VAVDMRAPPPGLRRNGTKFALCSDAHTMAASVTVNCPPNRPYTYQNKASAHVTASHIQLSYIAWSGRVENTFRMKPTRLSRSLRSVTKRSFGVAASTRAASGARRVCKSVHFPGLAGVATRNLGDGDPRGGSVPQEWGLIKEKWGLRRPALLAGQPRVRVRVRPGLG